ncbi:MAG TPA: hypothetical protein VNQ79_29075 [Blastocatellia bacterium]|nr:hypothetical protein [Blastocatellia bacterium]
MNTNVAILSAALTVIGLVLAIFSASWLNQRSMEKFIERLDRQMDARFASMDARFEAVLAEIKRLDQRIDGLEQRLDNRISSVEQRLDRIERQIEAIFKPSLPSR